MYMSPQPLLTPQLRRFCLLWWSLSGALTAGAALLVISRFAALGAWILLMLVPLLERLVRAPVRGRFGTIALELVYDSWLCSAAMVLGLWQISAFQSRDIHPVVFGMGLILGGAVLGFFSAEHRRMFTLWPKRWLWASTLSMVAVLLGWYVLQRVIDPQGMVKLACIAAAGGLYGLALGYASLRLWTPLNQQIGQLNVAFEQQDWRGVIAHITAILAVVPDHPRWLYERAKVFLLCNNDAAALADYERIIEVQPNSVLGWVGKARVLYNRGELDGSGACIEKVFNLDPANVQVYIGRALIAMQRHEWDAARADLDQALEIDGDNVQVHHLLAKLAAVRGSAPPATADA